MRIAIASILLVAVPAYGSPMGPPAPTESKTTPAQQAIALYRDEYRHGFRPCPQPSRATEVVVCGNGRGGSADRLPLPDERGPPDWARRPTGETPSAAAALASASDPCGPSCAGSGAIDLIHASVMTVQLIHGLIDPEWASDYADSHHPEPGRSGK